MAEDHVFDLLPGYALGCLDEDDLLKVARHLPGCAVCRNELSTYWSAVDHLALAAPLRTPPAGLKGKVLRRVEQAAQRQQPELERPSVRAEKSSGWFAALREWFSRPAGLAFGALALLVIVVLGASNFLLWQQVNSLQARVPKGNVKIVHLAGTPKAPQATGYLMVFQQENYGTLVVEDAPILPPGKQYQLWLIKDGKRTSGGVFSVDEQGYGTLQISAKMPLENYPSFGITIEPAGGSPGPTGDKVLGGNF